MSQDNSPVYGFLKNPSMVDYPGRLAAVFFLSGCNFTCGFCHNRELMVRKGENLSWPDLTESCRKFCQEWVNGAVITGGEPTLDPELPRLIEFFKNFGWAVKLDTNGSNPARLRECLPLVDYVAMDIKAGLSGYRALTGYGDATSIRESIELLKSQAADYEFRTTIIDPFHDECQMQEIREMVGGARRYILQPYVPREEVPDARYRNLSRTTPERLSELRTFMQGAAASVSVRGS